MSSQDNVKITSPASITRARSLVLSGYYVIIITNTALFIPSNVVIIPFPFVMIFNNIYTSILN